MTLDVYRVGKCLHCGRQVPGRRLPGQGMVCDGPCPRCGVDPLHLDGISPYTGDVGAMSESDAIQWINELEYGNEVEVVFRLEILGHPPDGREAVLRAGIERYWFVTAPTVPPAKTYSLKELIAAWQRELQNPESLGMYKALSSAHVGRKGAHAHPG